MTNKRQSQTITMHPVVGCLVKAEDFLGKGREWEARSSNPASLSKQKDFLELCLKDGIKDLSKFSENEFESIASLNASDINSFLKERGFNIELDPFDPKEGFATATVLKVLLEWVTKGTVSDIYFENKKYPAVSLKEDGNYISYHRIDGHNHPVLGILAKNGDYVYMSVSDEMLSDFELLKFVSKLSKDKHESHCFDFKNAQFPMITYDEKIDISWICKMKTFADKDAHENFAGSPMGIAQAKQQTKFRMNEIGAKVESAAAMSIMKCASIPRQKLPLIIDKPFVLWIERKGVSFPYFAAYFAEDSWKKPNSLE